MEKIPNEVLEKIVSYVRDPVSLWACRRVGKRWNEVTVKFWRESKTSRVQFLTDQRIHEFLTEMDFRIQDFPFARFKFISVNRDNVAAVKQLLRECSTYVQDLEIRELHDSLKLEDGNDVVDLITCLSTLILPNLEELRIDMIWPTLEAAVIPELSFVNLRILRLPILSTSLPIPAALIKGAPNLQLLEIPILIYDHVLTWPLPDTCKQIEVIEVNLDIKLVVEATTTSLVALREKLEDWRNVRVQRFVVGVSVDHPIRLPQTTRNIQHILDGQSAGIKTFTLNVWPSSFNYHLRMPAMAELRSLDISYHHNRNPLQAIMENPFSQLTVVKLSCCKEPTTVFRSAKLETVRSFVLHSSSSDAAAGGDNHYTRWDQVFPNLTSFTYSQPYNSHTEMDFSTLEFLVSHMRMDSLANVEYKIGTDHDDFNGKNVQRRICRIGAIFSGLDDLEDIVEKANEVREQGEDAEEGYWEKIEQTRRPCLANMKGLKRFHFDHRIDDNFAIGVLLRLNPLNLLTLDAKELSLGVFCRMIALHKSFCSTRGYSSYF